MKRTKLTKKGKESFNKIVDWRVKNNFLREHISNFEKLKDCSIFSIASFLLKTQLIEFEIKQLITGLDLHLLFSYPSKDLRRKPRTSKDLEDRRMTLGALSEEICLFEGTAVKDLGDNLGKLVKIRNKFVHGLFNPDKIINLINEAKTGLELANLVLKNIDSVNEYLKKNDPLNK